MFDELYIEEGYVESGYFVYIADANAELETIATKLTAAGVIGDFFVPMDSNTDLAVAGNVTVDAIVNLNSTVNSTASAGIIKQLSSDLISESNVSVDLVLIKTSDADLAAEFNTNIETTRLVDFATELETIATKLTAVSKIGDFFVPMDSNTSIQVDPNILKSTNIDLFVNSSLNVKRFLAPGRPVTVELWTGGGISAWGDFNDPATALNTRHGFSTSQKIDGNRSLTLSRGSFTGQWADMRIKHDPRNINANEDFVLEFYFRYNELKSSWPSSQNAFPLFFAMGRDRFMLPGESNQAGLAIQTNIDSRNFEAVLVNDQGVSFSLSSDIRFPGSNDWFHTVVRRINGNQLQLLFANLDKNDPLTVVSSTNYSGELILHPETSSRPDSDPVSTPGSQDPFRRGFSHFSSRWSGDQPGQVIFYDRFIFRIGDGNVLSVNNDGVSGEIETQFFLQWENNWDDTNKIDHIGSAALSVSSSLVARLPETVEAISAIQSNFDLSSEVGFVKSAEAETVFNSNLTIEPTRIRDNLVDADADFDLTATIGFSRDADVELDAVATKLTAVSKIGDFFVPMDSNTDLSVDISITKQLNSDLNSNFNQIADLDRFRSADSDLTFNTELTAETGYLRSINSDLNSNFDLAIETQALIEFNSDLLAEFDQITTGDQFKGVGLIDLNSTADLTATIGFLRSTEAELDVIATKLIAAAKIGDFFVPIDSVTDLAVDISITKQLESNLNSSFDLAIETQALIEFNSDLLAQFDQTTVGDQFKGTAVDLDSEFDLNSEVGFLNSTEAELAVTATKLIAAGVIGDFFVPMDSVTDLAVDIGITKQLESNLNSNFNIEASVGNVTNFAVSISAQFDQTVVADKFKGVGLIDLNSTADLESVGGYLFDSTVELDAVATKLIAAGVIGDFFVPMDSQSNIQIEPSVIRGLQSDLFAESFLLTVINSINSGTINLTSSFELAAELDLIKTIIADLQSKADQTAIISRTRSFDILLNTETDIITNAGLLADAEINLTTEFDIQAAGGVVQILQYVLRIQKEQRSLNILNENRTIEVRR